MNAHDTDVNSTLLPDHGARDVLARAATLDAHRDSAVSIRRLREIAREAGIHDDAFAKAVAVVRGATTRISSSLGAPWRVHHAIMIGINVLGVGIAIRHRARATAAIAGRRVELY